MKVFITVFGGDDEVRLGLTSGIRDLLDQHNCAHYVDYNEGEMVRVVGSKNNTVCSNCGPPRYPGRFIRVNYDHGKTVCYKCGEEIN